MICLFLPWISACSAIPQKGDLEHADVHRSEIKSLVDGGVIASRAEIASVDINALSGQWIVRSLVITPDQYKNLIQKSYVNLRVPSDSLSIHCENILQTAVAYTTYVPKINARVTEKYKLSMRDAECVSIHGEKIQVVVGIYNFSEPLSEQVPIAERGQRLEEALKWFSEIISFKQIDASIWEQSDMLFGEATGYIYHDVLGPIPNITLFEKKDLNYYRLVLISNWSVVAVDVMYPLSMPLDKLQTLAWPIIKALRYTNSIPAPQ